MYVDVQLLCLADLKCMYVTKRFFYTFLHSNNHVYYTLLYSFLFEYVMCYACETLIFIYEQSNNNYTGCVCHHLT